MAGKIAVVGGSGFIGTRLVRLLASSEYQIRILDIVKSQEHPDLWVYADIRDKDLLLTALAGCDVVINLAAEHADDVQPISLYDEVNVTGTRNLCEASKKLGIKKHIFTSSVAVYGLVKKVVDESGDLNPQSHYGRTKKEAEHLYGQWLSESSEASLTIVRPTVVFGERNCKGNVYNLIRQIDSNRFVMVGKGTNKKSMAYVENVAAFIAHCLRFGPGLHLFNYVDKPDFDMNTLIALIREKMGRDGKIGLRVPYWIGYFGGAIFDMLSYFTKQKFPISASRVKKFCASTQFSSSSIDECGFAPPYSIADGLGKTVGLDFDSN